MAFGWEGASGSRVGFVTRDIQDDTWPPGIIRRMIDYHALIDCCDREITYRTDHVEDRWASRTSWRQQP